MYSTLRTPKQATAWLLANTPVKGEYVDMPAHLVYFDLMSRYAPDVRTELYWPEQFRNPTVTSRFPGIPLGAALLDVTRFCGLHLWITDKGAVALSVPEKRAEAMRHGVVIEVDARDLQPVATLQKGWKLDD